MIIQKEHLSRKYKVIVIGGSAGSFQGITKILSSLPKDFSLPIVMALHRLKHVRHGFVEALSIKSALPVHEPEAPTVMVNIGIHCSDVKFSGALLLTVVLVIEIRNASE